MKILIPANFPLEQIAEIVKYKTKQGFTIILDVQHINLTQEAYATLTRNVWNADLIRFINVNDAGQYIINQNNLII